MKQINIIGGGISGLSAAINLADSGYKVNIFEKRSDCGKRFYGDLEGFENWSSKIDVIEEIKSYNIEINFDCSPFNTICLTDGKTLLENTIEKPMFYLVKRGTIKNSLDQGLKKQALNLGVKIHFNSSIDKNKADIISTGISGKKCVGNANGISFETDADDIAVALINHKCSNRGYSYLLVDKGFGTMCSVNLLTKNIDINTYFKKTYEMFTKLLNIKIKNIKKVGGMGCFLFTPKLSANGKLYTGEAAGLQDFLWGFGMRYAITSGYLAARSIIDNTDYEKLISEKILKRIKTSIVTRYLVELRGSRFSDYMINKAKDNKKWIEILHYVYNPYFISRLLYPYAKLKLQYKYGIL